MPIPSSQIKRRTTPRASVLAAAFIFVLAVPVLMSCGEKVESDVIRLGVIADVGGKDDKGKNALLWRGCQRAAEELALEIDYREPTCLRDARKALGDSVSAGADLIIVGAAPLEPAVLEVAAENPDVDFVVVDGTTGADNVLAVSFPLEEAGYIAGVAAAVLDPDGGFGFIGGRDDRPTRELYEGFARGVYEYTGAEVRKKFLGKNFEAPTKMGRARKAAVGMYESGTDIIFAAAGPSNVEVFFVAAEKNRYAIGSESNQNWVEPGRIFLSVARSLDRVVYEAVVAEADGSFNGGTRTYTVEDDVVCLYFDEENPALLDRGVIGSAERARKSLAPGAAPSP